jgi:hypothetical protein
MEKHFRILLGFLFSICILILAIFNFVPAIPQNLDYHHFADERQMIGIPNFWNVLSNLPFVCIGMYGFWQWQQQIAKTEKQEKTLMAMYLLVFFGIFLTGIGSAYYHWQPDNMRLIWDRLPMTLVFMPLLAVIIAEKIHLQAGEYAVLPLTFLGIFSVLYWAWTETQGRGDLRLYAVVQFYPMLAIPLIVWLFPKKPAFTKAFTWVAIFYMLAKITEYADKFILEKTILLSGHSLKHLFAGLASYYIVQAFVEQNK